ncbi:hypothetical protein CFK41_16340 [Brachybacterium ginsengisoli]|uniref:Glycosyl hydrolase n=1 Tax=Brachybacterium ginsengisoli TaxID=1331682 RepID=A0A291H133_9MICO|nr:glycoside hydrolase family 30 beta sandwich domain-containing protein [Brachybacterium ginsengisoli]ATG56171.1 hypothetical protein CFK41_16340 [Brachybacterium ginsengisoli]
MTLDPTRRTLLATAGAALGTAAGAGLLTAPAVADDTPRAAVGPAAPSSGAGRDWMHMLAQHHRVDRSGGVVATQGERELVWEAVPAADGPGDAVVEVDTSAPGHPLAGFGPALTHSAAWLLLEMPAQRRRTLLREMFSPTGPLRLTALRIPVGTSDFAPEDVDPVYYTFADEQGPDGDPLAGFSIARDEQTILPVLREIVEIARDLTVVLSPWSAPAWMKTSGSLIGGHLLDDEATRRTWATYLARAARDYEAAVPGLSVHAVTVQNEPLHETAAYPCMGMTPEVQAEVILHLLEELGARGLSSTALCYDHNWDRVDYPMDVLDALASHGVEGVGAAFHAYAGEAAAVDPLHEAHPGAEIWFTEQSGTQDPAKSYEGDFADGIWWMSNTLFLPALRHHHRGVILFNLLLDQDGGPGPDSFTNGTGLFQIDRATGELTPNAELYVMAHISRFVPAGTPTVASSSSTDLPTVACLRADGSVVVVLHNNAEARSITVRAGDRELTAELPGWTLATYVLTARHRVR